MHDQQCPEEHILKERRYTKTTEGRKMKLFKETKADLNIYINK